MKTYRGTLGVLALLFAALLPTSAAHAQVATSDARSFVGAWDVQFEGDQPLTIVLTIRDQEGRLAATANTMGADDTVRAILQRETALVLNYTIDYQGMPVPISITLTPGDEGVQASLSAADGRYTASGMATKR
jgi:hypothetical protein